MSVLRLLSTWGTFNCTSRKTNQRSIHRALKLFPLCKIPIQIKTVWITSARIDDAQKDHENAMKNWKMCTPAQAKASDPTIAAVPCHLRKFRVTL
jgi:hypothetical protein